ncbi:TPR repeat region-containing protein [Mycobacteroides abscessus]|uniref:TPR repeat region-containing protein n=1 Tax=Mycobacteroides abscessus TaxID=36809 RepID=UPI00266D5D42|nr:hypothetical protein [Mycobacteroides abscessus]MDO3058016.1 hypothetical protein [Mycobacteroides abscessus subsp. abscessus]MDO3276317.1 hypothetical protein [Mycobacteroides abscessus subsp. abscessus]
MSRPGKSVVYSANATALGDLAEPTRTLGTQVLDAAGKVHGAIADLDWEGDGKDAAVGRADRELAQDRQVVNGYNALADAYQNGAAVMAPMIADLTKTGEGLEADTFAVSEDWAVTDMFDYRAGKFAMMAFGVPEPVATERMNQLQSERGNEAQNNTASLQQRADALGQADQDTATAISGAKGDIDAAAPPAAGLSGEEGKKDLLDAIAVSKYTGMPVDPAALAKLVAAGTLSQADLDKLARGEKVEIPAGQMAYLYQMSQSLNGMSPEQIKELQRTLPADAQAALAQGLKIVSDPNVQVQGADQIKPYAQGATDATRGTFVPVTGSKVNLPSEMAKELSRTDRVTTQVTPARDIGKETMPSESHTKLNGVGAMQDIADILRPGAAISGSEATKSMLEAATQYANADIKHPDTGAYVQHFDSGDQHGGSLQHALADVVQVGGSDHLSVHDLATNPSTSDGFLHAMTQERWGDESSKIGDAFRWTHDDTGNPISGETANAVGHYVADHADTFKNMPGGGTFGEVNGGLAKAMADGVNPYLAQFAGADPETGFDSPGIQHFGSADQMKNLFSVFDQNHDSAISINGAAKTEYEGLVTSASQHGTPDRDLEIAGRLAHSMNEGANDAHLFDQEKARWEAAEKADGQKNMVENSLKALGMIPGFGESVSAIELAAKLTQPPGPNPLLIHGDEFARQLVDTGGASANSTDYRATVLRGLIARDASIAADPALAELITGDHVDMQKVVSSGNAHKILTDWFQTTGRNQYGVDIGNWQGLENVGVGKSDWSH